MEQSYYSTPPRSDEIYHYGVVGMKWGARKAGGYSRKEIRSDNKKAYKLGREATIADKAYSYALKKNKNGNNTSVVKRAKKERDAAISTMNKHRNALIKKYGKTKVSNIKYNRKGEVNERVNTMKSHALSLALTAGSTAAMATGFIPFGVIATPYSAKSYGKRRYKQLAYEDRKNSRRINR